MMRFQKSQLLKPFLNVFFFIGVFKKQKDMFTPRYVRVSSEYVCLVGLNDGDSVIFSVTPAVEFIATKLVNGGAEAQQPLGIIDNSRRKELAEIDVVELVVCNYCGIEHGYWKQN